MYAQRKNRSDPCSSPDSSVSAVRRRTQIEAKLLAYRCGWLPSDEIRIRKLTRELSEVLDYIGAGDPLAQQLIDV
jgi:hypothetical protein